MGYRLLYKASISGSGSPNYLNSPQDVIVLGNTAYVVGGESYLSAFDITNAMTGTITHLAAGQGGGDYPTGYFAGDTYWNEHFPYAYYTIYNSNSFGVWWHGGAGWVNQDTVTGAGAPNYLGGALHNAKSGDYAYIASYLDDVVSIYDVSDEFDIFYVAQASIVKPYSIGKTGTTLTAYNISTNGLVSISTWDVTNPAAPVFISSVLQDATIDPLKRISLRGSEIWVAGADDNTVTQFDTACAYVQGVRGNNKGNYELSNPSDIAISGDYAYVLSFDSAAFSVVDLTTMTAVAVVKDTDDPAYRMVAPRSCAISGNYLFFVCAGGGDDTLVIFDISDPLNPAHVSSVDSGDGVYLVGPVDIKINGNYAYVVNSSSLSSVRPFTVVDISDPANPAQAGRAHAGPTHGRKIAIDSAHNIAYWLGQNRVDVYDIAAINDDMTWLTWSGWTAYIDNATAIHLTADKLVLITNSDNDMLSAFFLSRTATFTLDAIIQESATKTATFTLDALIQETKTASFTLDAYIVERKTATFTLDAYIAGTASFTLDALIRETKTGGIATVDVILQKMQTATFTLDATIGPYSIFALKVVIRGTQTATLTADTILQKSQTDTFTADTILQKSQTDTFTADAVFLKTQTATFTLDAYITSLATVTVDTILLESKTATVTVDAVLLETKTDTFTADAVFLKAQTDTFTLDAYIASKATVTVDAILLETKTDAFTADAVFLKTQRATFTLDAYVASKATFTIDAILLETKTDTFTTDAILQKAQTATFTADAHIAVRQNATFTLDTYIASIATVTVDTILLETKTASFTIDSIIRETKTATFTLDVIIWQDTDAAIVIAQFVPTKYMRGRLRRRG